MDDCIFCKIIAGKIPAEVVYENDHAVCILDIHPIHYGHTLIIPRVHCRDFLELPPETYTCVLKAARAVSQALVDSLHLEGYNLFSNNGYVAGQSVFHFHFHVTPRYANDNIKFVLKLKEYANGEIRRTADLIRQSLPTNR
jgi:histidine triad (HIT) family protein